MSETASLPFYCLGGIQLKKEYILAGFTIACWGTVATVSKLLVNSLDALFVLAWSFLAGAAFMCICSWKTGSLKKLKELSWPVAVRMILIGSLGVFFYNYFLLLGTDLLKAQDAFVLNDLWPAIIIIASCLILHEKMTFGRAAAVICSFGGILVVATNGRIADLNFDSPRGVAFCLAAAVCYGLYCTLNKRQSYDKSLALLFAFASGALAAFILLFLRGGAGEIFPGAGFSAGSAAGILWNGIICNALPFLTWAMALDMGNTAVVANLAYLTPIVSLFVTHFVLGEEITTYSVAGLLLILSGIAVQILTQKKETARQELKRYPAGQGFSQR